MPLSRHASVPVDAYSQIIFDFLCGSEYPAGLVSEHIYLNHLIHSLRGLIMSEQPSIPIISWFDKPIKQSIDSVFDGVNKGVEALDFFNKYKKAHFKSLRDCIESVKILGMSAPINIEEIYYPTYVSTTIHRRLYKQEWLRPQTNSNRAPHELAPQLSHKERGDKFVDGQKRVIILGGPGTGKTTFLRHLALSYSEKSVFTKTQLTRSLFPVYVPLSTYSMSDNSLLMYMATDLVRRTDKYAESFIQRVMKKGLGVVLLDSLDEVPLKLRPNVISRIKEFCSDYPDCKIIISCRTADYEGGLETFHEAELAKLSKTAVTQIIRAWFKGDHQKGKQLTRHLKGDPSVTTLTETPLLLSLLCIQFRHDLSLPQRKTELYRRCVDTLLRDWDASRGFRRDTAYAKLSDERKERLFEFLAAEFFSKGPSFTFPQDELFKLTGSYCERFGMPNLGGAELIKEIERHHGIIERSSMDSFSFSHPSFQEYFAARYYVSHHKEMEMLKTFHDRDICAGVIEFIIPLSSDPEKLLQFLLQKSNCGSIQNYPAMARRARLLWLIYRCISLAPDIEKHTWEKLTRHLVQSQIHIAKIFRDGGVVPLAVLESDGIRHAYYYKNKRPTLNDALLQYRKLSNEILLSPSSHYAETVLALLSGLDHGLMNGEKEEMTGIFNVALILCLVIPLSTIRPTDVRIWLNKLDEISRDHFLKEWIRTTRLTLEKGEFATVLVED